MKIYGKNNHSKLFLQKDVSESIAIIWIKRLTQQIFWPTQKSFFVRYTVVKQFRKQRHNVSIWTHYTFYGWNLYDQLPIVKLSKNVFGSDKFHSFCCNRSQPFTEIPFQIFLITYSVCPPKIIWFDLICLPTIN